MPLRFRPLLALTVLALPGGARALAAEPQPLTLEQRIACRTAVEQVYWRHRIWPAENPGAKPPLAAVLPPAAVEAQVERTMRLSSALDGEWRRPVTARALRAELLRIWRETRSPELLRDLSRALGDDPYLLAECLARPLLVDRLARTAFAAGEDPDRSLESWLAERATALAVDGGTRPADYRELALPALPEAGAGEVGAWKPTAALPEGVAGISVVWTGAEMIVWGGGRDTGARYDPATDTWRTTAALGAPSPRRSHTAVWTGSEMIVWGGCGQSTNFCELGSGGRYHPATDSWTPIASAIDLTRRLHTAVWTGTEMIVFGGCRTGSFGNNACEIELAAAGRYRPDTDQWTLASTVDEPGPRQFHSAVWTGSEMIVWGGQGAAQARLASGGRYDPAADSWLATAAAAAPPGRSGHRAVWTGAEMIVWGGQLGTSLFDDGGRYAPATDAWQPTSVAGAPEARAYAALAWSGTEMIVWGGETLSAFETATGGRYDPATDSWAATSTAGAPPASRFPTAVWAGDELIVWGGVGGGDDLATGGRYHPATDSWTPTSTAGAPAGRHFHSAHWSGEEMLIWGGMEGNLDAGTYFADGGRYDPALDSWTPIPAAGAPGPRIWHASAWTGSELLVWGGCHGPANCGTAYADGGSYAPAGGEWSPTPMASAPSARNLHTGVWAGDRLIVWGGLADSYGSFTSTGGVLSFGPSPVVFADGFESGDMGAWSSRSP